MTATPELYSLKAKRVYVAGHRGMVGSALARRLEREGCEVLTAGRDALDLTRQAETEAWFHDRRPHAVFVAAAKVGGIGANRDHPAEFIYENLAISANVMEAAHRARVEKLVYLGSSCIYPRLAPQPIHEDALMTGPLEETNAAYAVAKIAGITMAQAYREQYGSNFISAQPTNLYGPGDNFDVESAHVIPALMSKAHDAAVSGARYMEVWGSGTPRREFLHVDDLADALVFLIKRYDEGQIINVGTGEDLSIAELARQICDTAGFTGELRFDAAKPDGTPRKLLDVSRLHTLGWRHSTPLARGIEETYRWFADHHETARGTAAILSERAPVAAPSP